MAARVEIASDVQLYCWCFCLPWVGQVLLILWEEDYSSSYSHAAFYSDI